MKLLNIKIQQPIPNIISVLFHPLIMPTIGVWLIFNSGSMYSYIYPTAKYKIIAVVFALTYLIPLLILPVFIYFRWMGHMQANERNERIFPLAITSVIYYVAYSFLKNYNVLTFIAYFMLAIALVMILLLIINFFTKVSLHMAGIGGLVGLLLFMCITVSPVNGWFLIAALLLSGVIATARLSLQAHNMTQILLGFFVGSIPVFLFFSLL